MSEEQGVYIGLEAQEKAETLQELAADSRSWMVLYRDPGSGQLWKESYPWAERHGGGPPRLEQIDRRQALLEFDVTEDDLDSGPAGGISPSE